MPNKGIRSDNNSGVHPEIMQAINSVNTGHVLAYGEDPYTCEAKNIFKKQFGNDIEVFFVLNGCAANILGLKAITSSFHTVICTDIAHINNWECSGPEFIIGCKILSIEAPDGKLTIPLIEKRLKGFGNIKDVHHAQHKVISITQATEFGTVYTPDELSRICAFAHEKSMLVHMDGARLSNAAAGLGLSLKALTRDVGIDVLSFGGTKNGMMIGEVVVFLDKSLSKDFKYIQKQGLQLYSKMRYVAAQFMAYFNDDLWLRNASRANQMARLLAQKIEKQTTLPVTRKVEANSVFVIIPEQAIEEINKVYPFDIIDRQNREVRWMASYDTTTEDVAQFVSFLESYFSVSDKNLKIVLEPISQ